MPTFTLASMVRQFALSTPDAAAVSFEETTLSFAELDRRSSRFANALSAAGVASGDRICLLARNAPIFYEAVFAASKIGAVVVALNWRLAVRELDIIAEDSGAKIYFSDEEFLPKLAAVPGRKIALGAEFEQFIADASDDDPTVDVAADAVILQLYSSGTTGLPKGIMITNSNLSQTPTSATELFRMAGDSVNLVVSPLFHVGGIGYGLHALSQGGHTVIAPAADATTLYGLIERWGVTHSFMVPSMIQSLLESPLVSTADTGSLQYIAYGGATMSDALMKNATKAFGCGFTAVYGMTETAGTVVGLIPDETISAADRVELLRSCGKPLPWMGEIAIFDPATSEKVGPGAVGEIWVRSAQVTPGYWNLPEATSDAIRDDGWFRTGDAAYADEKGYFYLCDRLKDMIITGGENVFPAEVESVLFEIPALLDVAVIGVASERWGETVKAVAVLRPGSETSEAEVIAYARDNLAHYKCPTSVDFVAELPKSAAGKVLKPEIRSWYKTAPSLTVVTS